MTFNRLPEKRILKRFSRFLACTCVVAGVSFVGNAGAVAADELKIALITSTTGPMEVYAKQSQMGLQLGLEYATQGSMVVNGEPIVVIQKDDQTKPARARAVIGEAFVDDEADIAIGSTSSATTLAMMPIAEEQQKPLIVEVAGATSITGDKWNPYVVRTGRTVAQEAVAAATFAADSGTCVAILTQDYAFGRESASAFKAAAENLGATVVAEEYLPVETTDFTGPLLRIFEAVKDCPGKKKLFVNWIGTTPVPKIAALDPSSHGIELIALGTPMPGWSALKGIPNVQSALPYYYDIPKNPINEWFAAEHIKRFGTPPDVTGAFAFDAGVAIVQAVKQAGTTESEALLAAFKGMTFEGTTGQITIKPENNQAIRDFYGVVFTDVSGVDWAVPKLVRKFDGAELDRLLSGK